MDFELPVPQYAALAAAATTGYCLLRGLYLVYLHPLSKVPGPKYYALSDWFYLYHQVQGNWPFILKSLHDKYGPVVRIAPDDVSTIAPESWKTIYGHKAQPARVFRKDRRFYGATFTGVDNLASADFEDHRRMRRVMAHSFSETALRGQEDVVNRYTDILLSKLTNMATTGEATNITAWYNYFTFDLIGDLAFGKSFNNLERAAYSDFVALIFDSIKIIAYSEIMQRHTWLGAVVSRMIPKRILEGFENTYRLSRATAMQRVQSGNTEREDFMSYILRHNNDGSGKDGEKGGRGMTEDEIAENAVVLIGAGSETTATLLSGATFRLLSNRHVYDRLVTEIRTTFASAEDITMASVAGLEYLDAVIQESFRMYPPVPIGPPRVVPDGGESVNGYFLPGKTGVSLAMWSAFQSSSNFYQPQSFLPERWLTDKDTATSSGFSVFANDNKDVMQPFSSGPRNCIGKNLAMAEIRLVLTRVLYHFDLAFDTPPPHVDSAEAEATTTAWDKQKIFILWDKGPLMVRLSHVRR